MYVGMAGAVLTTAVLTNFIKMSVQSCAACMSALILAAGALCGALSLAEVRPACRLVKQFVWAS